MVADADMDAETRADMIALTGCIAGALTEKEFRHVLTQTGFSQIEITVTHRVHLDAAAAIIRAHR